MGQKGEPGAPGPGFARGIAFGNPSMVAPPSGFSRAGEGSVSLTTGVNRLVLQKATVEYILLNNQRDAALSSCIYSSLQGHSTCFGCFLHPSSGVQLKLQMQS
jgi:hypothetical protein